MQSQVISEMPEDIHWMDVTEDVKNVYLYLEELWSTVVIDGVL